MKKWFVSLSRFILVLFFVLGLSKPNLVIAASNSQAVAGAIWTNFQGCDVIQNANHYEVGQTVYVHYSNFDTGIHWLYIQQTDGAPPKPFVEGPRLVYLSSSSGCFAAHLIEEDEAGHEYKATLGTKFDNYQVDEYEPTPTVTPTETDTPEPTETDTPEPTETDTPEPTETDTPEPTETDTPEPTETDTPEPTETDTPEPTETDTPEPTETDTPEPTETDTPEPTETDTPEPTETTPAPTETTPAPTEETQETPDTTPTGTSTPPPPPPPPPATEVPIPVTAALPQLVIPVTGSPVIVAGLGHTCMTYGEGVLCWGLNSSGQVGNGDFVDQLKPVYVENLTGVLNLAAGSLHTCALTIDNQVMCWGENGSGQLGNGSTTDSNLPVSVSGLPDDVLLLTAGEKFTCAQLRNQEVWCWGENGEGQLNDGTTTDRTTPVKSLLSAGQNEISGGQSSVLGSTLTSVEAWKNSQAAAVKQFSNPLSISANRWGPTGCAVSADGTVKCWSDDLESSLVSDALAAMKVGAGQDHNCVINENLTISCWGANSYGELGNGTNNNSDSAVVVKTLSRINELAVGAHHTCVLQGVSNVAWCWGENTYGQLGVNSTTNSNLPMWVYLPLQ